MVRKTDQRTFASTGKGQEPKLETITRETIETFRGQRTECKITTETKDSGELVSPKKLTEVLSGRAATKTGNGAVTFQKKRPSPMDFQSECLRAHNAYRKRHGVPPLRLDKDMCRAAQAWANYLIKRPKLQHSSSGEYGENLFCLTSSSPGAPVSGQEVVDSWYDEIQCHTFGVEPDSLASGHFTQVVWRDSRRLGAAVARQGGRVVAVANYHPPGNLIGSFAENVPPPNGGDAICAEFAELSVGEARPGAAGVDADFEEGFLRAHNEYRRRHGVPPLRLDRRLCRYSEEWARHLAARNTLEHRPSCNYGENIYCMYSSNPRFTITGSSPVDAWYEEAHHHPFGREPNSLKSGHFSQVVWRSSEWLGVGVASNSQGSIYVVANYSPAGNFVGHYVENVPPPIKEGAQAIDGGDDERHASGAEGAPDGGCGQFALDGLRVHNEYRRRHGVAELKLDKELCEYAQEWADTCAKSGSMCCRANNPYGENIFCVYSSDYSHVPCARDAVKEWYDEVKKHTFGAEGVNHATLHFTQVVWRASTLLGFAMARNNKGEAYIVANYSPRGNVIGHFATNVPRPKS